MGYTLLEDSIEINPTSLRKYNQNIHTLHTLCLSLNNALDGSKHFVTQVEAFMASSFNLASDLHKIGLQIPDIGELSVTMSQLNKEINQLLPHSLRECKLLLETASENHVAIDHTETFKNLKQEVDKYLIDSIQYRRELKQLLIKNTKSSSDSQNDKISLVMAKITSSIGQYQRYLSLLESELSEFCGNRHKYLLTLSKSILNLHHLVHFGRKMDSISPDTGVRSSTTIHSKYNYNAIPDLNSSNNNNNNSNNNNNGNNTTRKLSYKPPSSFKEIVLDPVFLKAFTMFSEKQHGLENLLFWIDAQSIKSLENDLENLSTNRETIRTQYINVYNNYIASGANYEINIDSESRNEIEERRLNLFTDDPFFPSLISSVESIEGILNYSIFPLFVKSPLYHAAILMNKSASHTAPTQGLGALLQSLDALIRNPIGLEYFLLYLSRSTANTSSPTTSPPTTPLSNSPPSPNSLSPRSIISMISPLSVSQTEAKNMVYFWLEVNKYRELSDEYLESYAMDIFTTYLKVNAEKELTTFSNSRYHNTIQDNISSKNISRELFASLLQDVIFQLTNSHFPAFLQHQVCRDMMAREEKMLKYLEKDKGRTKPSENKVEQQFEHISKEKAKTPPARLTSIKPGTNLMPINERSNSIVRPSPGNGTPPSSAQHLKELPPLPPKRGLTSSSNSAAGDLSSSGGSVDHETTTTNNNSPHLSSSGNSSNSGSALNVSKIFSPNIMSVSSLSNKKSSSNLNDYIVSSSSPTLNSSGHHGHHHHSPNYSINVSGGAATISSPSLSASQTSPTSDKPNEVFNFILTDQSWLDAFKRFVKSEKCEELLLCWMDLERYANRGTKVSIASAQNIYDNFFQDGSPLEVNLEIEVKNQMRDALKNKNMEEIEVAIRISSQSAFELLRVDTFSRFLKSPIYREVSNQLGDPFEAKNRKKLLSKK
ncbi:hypothetical protein PPL_08262 [Heterostelium album PN500]|uniref:RGS domain-containing protein n=1 Tax=Heterostelium pallidum (strain ATCC 26659 / Pp 5 / PN500) TaxID=670386 RepID=D3BHP9_HETP5|nr:hypothetical protein PPL_08262 [Heterostelium album PN500]EFA78799.1 hypothetical protein PPL_08262 [Heterostelium album PN500]|eukprot:XP_020430923.1 hypothetical protein PPL_08262 [Heterostelium album PN500]